MDERERGEQVIDICGKIKIPYTHKFGDSRKCKQCGTDQTWFMQVERYGIEMCHYCIKPYSQGLCDAFKDMEFLTGITMIKKE